MNRLKPLSTWTIISIGELFSSSQRAHFFFPLVYNLLQIDPSGWKGSLTYGLGADFSLPQCLATGIGTFHPKAITWQKSRGTLFGTTLWCHVQRYSAHLLVFIANEDLKSINTNKDMVQVDFAIFLALKLFRK